MKLSVLFPSRRARGERVAFGFSLIELLLVIAIILIIAAIAVPSFLKSRLRANETAVVAALRTITTAQLTYQSRYQQGFPPNLGALAPPPAGTPPTAAAADLLDTELATPAPTRHGYNFLYTPVDADGNGQPEDYQLNANPVAPGRTGDRYFYVDQTAIIRFALGGPANNTSTPIPPN